MVEIRKGQNYDPPLHRPPCSWTHQSRSRRDLLVSPAPPLPRPRSPLSGCGSTVYGYVCIRQKVSILEYQT